MDISPLIPPGIMFGVNLGGWLCLEAWVFSEEFGVSVATHHGELGQGHSLPPSAAEPIERLIGTPVWSSEGKLTWHMNHTIGPDATAAVLEAHRTTFVTSQDFVEMASAGVRAVRVPLTWTLFADALAPLSDVYKGVNERTTIVPDPFYSEEVAFATIPRAWLAEKIREAGAAGLKVTLDMHNSPGGAQDGAYNGVFPLRPAFWANHSRVGRPVRLTEVGLWIVDALIRWVEVDLDAEARRAIHAFQFMNEPAFMNTAPPFARVYHPFAGFAREQDVLDWMDNATSRFRASSLPQAGIKVLVHLDETAFENYSTVVPAWFERTFAPPERASWVVLSHQYYAAYNPKCNSEPGTEGGFACSDPVEEARLVMRGCLRAVDNATIGHLSEWPQRAIAEFSLGTANHVAQQCFSRELLTVFLQEQLEAFADLGGTEAYFWSWKMPAGPCFEPGWSLQHFTRGAQPSQRCQAWKTA